MKDDPKVWRHYLTMTACQNVRFFVILLLKNYVEYKNFTFQWLWTYLYQVSANRLIISI